MEIQIHGDNVVECERALRLIEEALQGSANWVAGSHVTCPTFELSTQSCPPLTIQFLPGHNRWGVGLAEALQARGATLREGADAVLTRKEASGYELLLGLEFCGALPAGNNAWQRHGRALAFAQADIPYLIFAEVGGQELTAERDSKASRFPNPAVPFALVQASLDHSVAVLPVYEPAPSAPEAIHVTFAAAFGRSAAAELVRSVILSEDPGPAVADLRTRALRMVQLLSNARTRSDSLRGRQWEEVLEATDRFATLKDLSPIWTKRMGTKVLASPTAAQFVNALISSGARALYSASLPMAWLPSESTSTFLTALSDLYGDSVNNAIGALDKNRPLVVVLVTGFKPRGDDSRPDRGLMPLGRMLAGPEEQVLTFIWGPAKARMLGAIRSDIEAAARDNGLIEAARACSDAVIVDSINAAPFGVATNVTAVPIRRNSELVAPSAAPPSEHDVDGAVHFALTQPARPEIFEGMCNPPGGDWSGISLKDASGLEVRWTSLPRVSSSGAKRPDHVLQLRGDFNYLLSVESKHVARDLESEVGPALVRYLTDLMASPPNIGRTDETQPWRADFLYTMDPSWKHIYSVATFKWSSLADLTSGLEKAAADLGVAWHIDPSSDRLEAHLLTRPKMEFLAHDFKHWCETSLVRVVVQEH